MKILEPTQITPAMLVSCTIAEDDGAPWAAETAYTVGERVIAAHRVYEALTASTGKPPADSPDDWLDMGPTNRWKMFDDRVGTASEATETMTVEIAPGIVSALALINVSAANARVTMTDPVDGVVYDRMFGLYDPHGIDDWWPYFFSDVLRTPTLVVRDLPSYRGAVLSVTLIDGPTQTVALGALVAGVLHTFGRGMHYGAAFGIQDYSRKERDAWGGAHIVERDWAKTARWRCLVPRRQVDVLVQLLTRLRARPALYIGSASFDSAMVYGFYRDFDVVIAYPMESECAIEIEGLT